MCIFQQCPRAWLIYYPLNVRMHAETSKLCHYYDKAKRVWEGKNIPARNLMYGENGWLDTYKSGNGDLKVPNLASAIGITPEMNIFALRLHGVGMSPGGPTGALSTAPGSGALLILFRCFHSTQHTSISWPYGVRLKTMGSGYLDSNLKLFPSWLCQGVWDSVYSSVKWRLISVLIP